MSQEQQEEQRQVTSGSDSTATANVSLTGNASSNSKGAHESKQGRPKRGHHRRGSSISEVVKTGFLRARRPSQKKYFTMYILVAIFVGICQVYPATIFGEMQFQLNLSIGETSLLFTGKAFGYIISVLISTLVIDLYKQTHLYLLIFILLTGLFYLIMTFLFANKKKDEILFGFYYFLTILFWIVIGYCQASLNIALPIYISFI